MRFGNNRTLVYRGKCTVTNIPCDQLTGVIIIRVMLIGRKRGAVLDGVRERVPKRRDGNKRM